MIEAVKAEPAIKASKLAKDIGAAPSQVHAILKTLREDANPVVKKDGAGYSAVGVKA